MMRYPRVCIAWYGIATGKDFDQIAKDYRRMHVQLLLEVGE